jgi:uroporphyrin-3 C-methyltransferase
VNKSTESGSPESVDKGSGRDASGKPPEEKKGEGKEASAQKDEASKPTEPKPSGSKSTEHKPGQKGGKPEAPRSPSSGGGSGTPPPSRAAGGKGGGKAGVVAIVLVILLAIVGLFYGWQFWQAQQAQQQRLAELADLSRQAATTEQLNALETRLEEKESELESTMQGALDELQGEFSSYRSEVNNTLDRVLDELSREQDTDEREWLHAEAAYLLRLANQRLQLERDVEGAAALLRTADGLLEEADNPALVPVRREIASELAALDAVPRVDRTGLYLALNAQQEQIANQPLAQDIEEMTANTTLEEVPSGGWQEQLSLFGSELRDLVTVRKHDQALEALITPEQESYLRQSVRLVLEQSQLALLKEEEALYEASIDKAMTLIRGYYDTDAEGVQAVLDRLEELKQRRIRPELPDISGSQQAMATFIERRFQGRDDVREDTGQGDDA